MIKIWKVVSCGNNDLDNETIEVARDTTERSKESAEDSPVSEQPLVVRPVTNFTSV